MSWSLLLPIPSVCPQPPVAHVLTRRLQVLAAFLKAIGCIIPLMDAMYASYYTREVMLVLVREFQTPDEEMKKIVLKVRPLRACLRLLVLLAAVPGCAPVRMAPCASCVAPSPVLAAQWSRAQGSVQLGDLWVAINKVCSCRGHR